MQIKVIIDIQEDARDLIPDTYLPADVVVYRCNSDFISVEKFLGYVNEDIKRGVWHVCEKKGKAQKR